MKTGFVRNVRFYGEYEPGIDRETGQRKYSADKGHDPVWALVRILFPSTGGTLSTVSTAAGNFGASVTQVSTIARIIEYLAKIRDQQDQIDRLEIEKRDIAKGPASTEKIRELNARGKQVRALRQAQVSLMEHMIRQMSENLESQSVVRICTDLITNQMASETKLGYEKFTVEQILLAFAVQHLPGQNIVDAYDAELTTSVQDEYLAEIYDHFQSAFSPASENPFGGSVSSLISNGLAKAYDRKRNCHYDELFADCVETVIRHICTLIHARHPSRSAVVNEYFARYPYVNDPSIDARSAWNAVVGDIDGIQCNSVHFGARYNMVSCFETIVDVVSRVMNIELPQNISITDRFTLIIKDYTSLEYVNISNIVATDTRTYGICTLENDVITLTLHVNKGHAELTGVRKEEHNDTLPPDYHTLIVNQLHVPPMYTDIVDRCFYDPKVFSQLPRYTRRNIMRAVNKEKFNDFTSIASVDIGSLDRYYDLFIDTDDLDDLVLGIGYNFRNKQQIKKGFPNLRFVYGINIPNPPKTLRLMNFLGNATPEMCANIEELRYARYLPNGTIDLNLFPVLKKIEISPGHNVRIIGTSTTLERVSSMGTTIIGDLRGCTSLIEYFGAIGTSLQLPESLKTITVFKHVIYESLLCVPNSVENLTFLHFSMSGMPDIVRLDTAFPRLKEFKLHRQVKTPANNVTFVVGNDTNIDVQGALHEIQVMHVGE